MKSTTFQRIWLPGFVFQSVLIGGGYATGREFVEFFLSKGPAGGLLGMVVATVSFSLIVAITFEFARLTRSYDYRSFFRALLGPAWFLFEVGYFLLALVVLAVLGAASGEIVSDHLGSSNQAGIIGMMVLIGLLVFWGTALIERVLAWWSFLLSGTYVLFLLIFLYQYGAGLAPALAADSMEGEWLSGSLRYVGYSVVVVPVILFCARHLESRRDALLAGALAGPMAMAPGFLFYLSMAASYPAIIDAPVPADFMIQKLDIGWLEILFYIVVFGTLVETGGAMIHAINERINHVYAERTKTMPRWMRPLVALIALVTSVILADRIGLIDLVARGYGTLTYFFIMVMIVPLFTIGLWRILRSTPPDSAPPGGS